MIPTKTPERAGGVTDRRPLQTHEQQIARQKAAELADVAMRLQSARETPDLLVITAELASAFFACPLVAVASLGRKTALLDVAGPAAELVRDEAAVPTSPWCRSLAGNEPLTVPTASRPVEACVTHAPLIPGRGRAVGVLSLYWSGAPADLTYLGAFSTHVAVAMESLWYQTRLHLSMETHRLESSSLGMLMERYGIDSGEAYDVLSGVSLEHNVKLREIARRVIDERELPASG
jgi:hypothetical protein